MKDIKTLLEQHGQQHMLPIWQALPEGKKQEFESVVAGIDWQTLESWRNPTIKRGYLSPIKALELERIQRDRRQLVTVGIELVRKSKLAAVMLAGGQGTRLGSDAPKGTYDIGVTHPVYIFERQIANLLSACELCQMIVPLFIMTSKATDAATREFLKQHNYFGYPPQLVRFFEQEMCPVVDFEGHLIPGADGLPIMAPNGNGRWYYSLAKSGLLREFGSVEWLNVFAVDNVLQRPMDPAFVGATFISGLYGGAKVVRKNDPYEHVGVMCREDNMPAVVEYFDLTPQLAEMRKSDGSLMFGWGVILNYIFNVRRLRATIMEPLPVHVVPKKVPVPDANGNLVQPATENAFKFETLIIDQVRKMNGCLAFEVAREREFAPIKNKTGVDSVESARELLRQNGVEL